MSAPFSAAESSVPGAEDRSDRGAPTTLFETPHLIPDLLRLRAAEAPERVAVVVDQVGTLTYGEWEARSNAAARGLLTRGVKPGDPVALVFSNGAWIDYAVSYLAVQKAGGLAVPLGPRFAGAELDDIIKRCGATAVVVGGTAAPPGSGFRWLSLPELESGARSESVQVPLSEDAIAEVLYTSGTTGLAKGVACTHANLLFHAPPPEPEVSGGASVVHAFPVGTNAGQEVLRLPLRRNDRTAVILATFDPERYCEVIEQRRVRRLQLVPAMAQMIVTSGAAARHDVSGVERVVLSSAPCPPTLVAAIGQAFSGAAVWNTYALTEAGTARTLNTDALSRPESVGRPVGSTELRLIDEAGQEVAAGSVGEVLLRYPGAPSRSYYHDPEATALTFDREGWIHTGDLGYLDSSSSLVLVDRKKDLIIVGGLNVSSVGVEGVLLEHRAVADVAVFGVDHPVLGQDVAAAVVRLDHVEGPELQAFARARLAEYEVPHRIVFVDKLPRTASGKVRKTELRDRFGGPAPAGDPTAKGVVASTDDEVVIVAIWRDVFGRDDIGVADDFFELGGHSLAAAQISNRIASSLGIELPIMAVFEWSTPADLAQAVARAREEQAGTGEHRGDGSAPAG